MRKLIPIFSSTNVTQTTLLPSTLSPPLNSSSIHEDNEKHGSSTIFHPIPLSESAFDLASISLISGLLLLSLLSVAFIFHLRLKSRRSHHLRNFNSLWTVRFLLVSFNILWCFTEILRLPFFRRRYLYPFLPSLSLSQQASLCKVHVVLSLGLFKPGFLVTLLFLVNVSVHKRNPRQMWAITFVLIACCPILLLQTLLAFFSPSRVEDLPGVFRRSFVLSKDGLGNKMVLCSYPLLNTIVFAAFGGAYALWFLLSCWRVVSLVINKGIRVRIQVLCFTVMISLPLQILVLAFSALWMPDKPAYRCLMLIMCLNATVGAAIGEGILVIKPIADALSASGDCCRWAAGGRVCPDVDKEEMLDNGS
ncbi:uncharacterized protein LOC132314566 [Cornus florida]|uniref:uncharacterized protein LOC132314566 n=1 Tax=Cornus florida TaxID=4283 RepID=UPI00289B340B|nr:uncharacterized protein LOC132314566 [Cornus florida]